MRELAAANVANSAAADHQALVSRPLRWRALAAAAGRAYRRPQWRGRADHQAWAGLVGRSRATNPLRMLRGLPSSSRGGATGRCRRRAWEGRVGHRLGMGRCRRSSSSSSSRSSRSSSRATGRCRRSNRAGTGRCRRSRECDRGCRRRAWVGRRRSSRAMGRCRRNSSRATGRCRRSRACDRACRRSSRSAAFYLAQLNLCAALHYSIPPPFARRRTSETLRLRTFAYLRTCPAVPRLRTSPPPISAPTARFRGLRSPVPDPRLCIHSRLAPLLPAPLHPCTCADGRSAAGHAAGLRADAAAGHGRAAALLRRVGLFAALPAGRSAALRAALRATPRCAPRRAARHAVHGGVGALDRPCGLASL